MPIKREESDEPEPWPWTNTDRFPIHKALLSHFSGSLRKILGEIPDPESTCMVVQAPRRRTEQVLMNWLCTGTFRHHEASRGSEDASSGKMSYTVLLQLYILVRKYDMPNSFTKVFFAFNYGKKSVCTNRVSLRL